MRNIFFARATLCITVLATVHIHGADYTSSSSSTTSTASTTSFPVHASAPLINEDDFTYVLNKYHRSCMQNNVRAFEPDIKTESKGRGLPVTSYYDGSKFDIACKENNLNKIERWLTGLDSSDTGSIVASNYSVLNQQSLAFVAEHRPYAIWHVLQNKFTEGNPAYTKLLYTYLSHGFMIPFVAQTEAGPVVPILHYILTKIDASSFTEDMARIKSLVEGGFNVDYEFKYITTEHTAEPDTEKFSIQVQNYNTHSWTKEFVTLPEAKENLLSMFKNISEQRRQSHRSNTTDLFLPNTRFCFLNVQFTDAFTNTSTNTSSHNYGQLEAIVKNQNISSDLIAKLIPRCTATIAGKGSVEALEDNLKVIKNIRPELTQKCNEIFVKLMEKGLTANYHSALKDPHNGSLRTAQNLSGYSCVTDSFFNAMIKECPAGMDQENYEYVKQCLMEARGLHGF